MTISMRFQKLIPVAVLAVAMIGLASGVHVAAQATETPRAAGQAAGGEHTTPAAESPEVNQGEKDENDAYRHSKMVQKMGSMFGMNVETAATTFEVLNFAVLALAIGFGLLKVLPKTFRDRSGAIQKHLVDAKKATEEASARLNSVEERLSKLDDEIAGMRAQAEKDAAADEVRIRATVEEEKKKIVASAEQEIAAASMLAQRQLQQYAAELAIEQAARKLVVSAETDRLLVQSFARRLTGNESGDGTKGGQN